MVSRIDKDWSFMVEKRVQAKFKELFSWEIESGKPLKSALIREALGRVFKFKQPESDKLLQKFQSRGQVERKRRGWVLYPRDENGIPWDDLFPKKEVKHDDEKTKAKDVSRPS